MVDASVDAWELPANLVGGRAIRVCGPIGKAVGEEHSRRYLTELARLTRDEPRITFRNMEPNVSVIYIDDGQTHAYNTYAGLAQEVDVDTDLWTSHVVLTYATDDAHYEVLSEKGKRGVYRNPEFCAALALNAVKAHMAVNFKDIPVTEQYSRQDIDMYAAIARQRGF